MKSGKGFNEVTSMYKSVANPIPTIGTRNNVISTSNLIMTNSSNNVPVAPENPIKIELSQQKLTEAIIWSEILGKPLCKRRKSR